MFPADIVGDKRRVQRCDGCGAIADAHAGHGGVDAVGDTVEDRCWNVRVEDQLPNIRSVYIRLLIFSYRPPSYKYPYVVIRCAVSGQDQSGAPPFARRYEEFRDDSGAWSFEIREYRTDLESIGPVDLSPDPTPREAYRAAVFLEGFIREQKSTGHWSDATLDRFDSFESTLEVEAVAKALREFRRDERR